MKKVGLYMDVSNLYYCIRNKYQSKLDYKKFYDFCAGYGEIKRAVAYGAQINNQADAFIACLHKAGFETSYKTPKTYNKGTKLQQSKADQDVNITVDIITDSVGLDLVILGSADGDFAPLVEYLINNGKQVVIMGTGISHELALATQVIEIPQMVVI